MIVICPSARTVRVMDEFIRTALENPSRLRLSEVLRGPLGVPYVWVLSGGVALTARVGLTPGMARWLGKLRIKRLTTKAAKYAHSTRNDQDLPLVP